MDKDEIKKEAVEKVNTTAKEMGDKLVAAAAGKPWYTKVTYYILAAIAFAACYATTEYGDAIANKAEEIITNVINK